MAQRTAEIAEGTDVPEIKTEYLRIAQAYEQLVKDTERRRGIGSSPA